MRIHQGLLRALDAPEEEVKPAPDRLARLRSLAHSEGLPLDSIDRMAMSPARVARILDVSRRTIEKELEEGNLATTWIRGCRRIATLDLVEYLDLHRAHGPRAQSDAAQVVDSWLT